ncbi:hypothetical protein CEP53_001153 [Fusarium sp. AF-6]|nr:hypothetical protein CEP53_001153 [Fusarium sp. AF-6]
MPRPRSSRGTPVPLQLFINHEFPLSPQSYHRVSNMAWFKDALTKAVQQASQEYQRERARQQQGQQQQHQAGGSSSGGSWQRQPQSPQYQQPQSPYGQPQAQYQQYQSPYGQPQAQYQQYQQPQLQPQQQYQQPQYQHVPPPLPYGPTNPQHSQDLAQIEALAEAQLQAARAQATQVQAEAEAQLQAAKAQMAQEQARAQAAQDEATKQLEARWREAERLAAQYKAQYEAQMKSAEEEMARLNLEAEKQQRQAQEELAASKAEEAKQQQRAEDEIIKEQQRLLDEIQKAKEEAEVAPPLPRRPVSMVETGQPQSYQPPPSQRNSYLAPLPGPPSHPPPSPSQGQYMPPPPPGPPPIQTTTPSHPNRQSVYLSPTSVPTIQLPPSSSPQKAPYYPPPPSSPSQQQYHAQYSPSQPVQGQPTHPAQQNTFQSPSLSSRIPADQLVAIPSQQQVPHYPPPPPNPPQPQSQATYTSPPPPPIQTNSRDSHPPPAPTQGVTSPSQITNYPPPPSLPPRVQTNMAQEDQNLHTSPAPTQGVTSPSQAPSFPPPPCPPPPGSSGQPAKSSPQQVPQASPADTQPTQKPDPTPPKPPRVHTPGPPVEHASGAKTFSECSAAITTTPQHWFFHPSVPEFTICACCYVKHIYDTRFRDSFTKMYSDDKEQRRCRFSTNRLKDTLFPEAIKSGSLDECLAFMRKRMTIRDCLEQTQTEGDAWYTTSDIPNSTICQACFEDGFSGTSFAKHYQLQTVQGACFCDSTAWFLKRKFSEYLKEDNWAKFAEEMSVRVTLPPCPRYEDIKANDRQWYKPKNGPASLQACVTCCFDYFYRSEDEDLFEQVSGGDFLTRCTMGQPNMLIPMRQALADEDRSLFWKAAFQVDKYPFCHKDGIKGGTWYTLPGNTAGWGICAACYEGVIKSVGGSRWFIQDKDVSQDETYLCCFSLGHDRVQGSLQAYDNARNLGDWKILFDYAVRWTNVRVCPRAKHKSGKNRPWWGWGVLAICEECYLNFAQGTELEPRFALKGAREPDNERMCDLFSPRMRGLYTEACKTGDLEGLLAFAEQRHVIYTQTIMQCEQILTQQRIAASRAQYLGMQGSFYKNLGWSHDAVVGHSYTVGNSYAGYGHANGWVSQGYAYDRQASEMRAQVGGGNVLQLGMLEARWKEVE